MITTEEIDDGRYDLEVVNNAMNENKGNRLNWKEILGVSLTKWVYMLRKEGMDAKEVIKFTCNEHPMLRRKDYFDKLKIGVNARFGEMNTADEVKYG